MRWLKHMPPLPLPSEGGVPLVLPEGHRGLLIDGGRAQKRSALVWDGMDVRDYPAHTLRVDLDHPMGFAYALRWVSMNGKHPLTTPISPTTLLHKWVFGRELPTERIGLAQLCAEVVASLAE